MLKNSGNITVTVLTTIQLDGGNVATVSDFKFWNEKSINENQSI